MAQLSLFTIILLICSLNQVASEVYYIKANSNDLCTTPCLTLSQLIHNSSNLLTSNTTLIFHPRMHYLNVRLTVANSSNFSMTSENSTAQIRCTNFSQIVFSHSHYIHIHNMEFIGCGGNRVENATNFVVRNTAFKGQENGTSGSALELIGTTARIINCTFLLNQKGQFNYYRIRLVGGAIIATHSNIDIGQSLFAHNKAEYGGVIFAEDNSIVTINDSTFAHNTAIQVAGVLYSVSSTITIDASDFYSNTANYSAVLHAYFCSATIGRSVFSANTGGLLFSTGSVIMMSTSKIHNNTEGEALLYFIDSIVTLDTSDINDNNAASIGAIALSFNCTITADNTNFTSNNVSVFVAYMSTIILEPVLIVNNQANGILKSVIFLAQSDIFLRYNSAFSHNLGSLTAFSSNITFMGHVLIVHNQSPQTTTLEHNRQGGAITLIQSNAFFNGTCRLEHNYAEHGGAIFSTGSKLYIIGNVTIANNKVTRNGGGVYLSNSELKCQRKSTLVHINNTAIHQGGGIHAISSSITAISTYYTINKTDRYYQNPETTLQFTNNAAEKGGGLSLESNTRLYILKYNTIDTGCGDSNIVIFMGNSADYGGAVFVNDDTNPACASDQLECFFQVVSVDFGSFPTGLNYGEFETRTMFFLENHASISGSTLYGGLLDRCVVSQFAEVQNKYQQDYQDGGDGVTYFGHVSTFTNSSISSHPVQVCLCTRNGYNCTHPSITKSVRKGETFTVPLVAVDQIGQPVNAIIQTSLNFTESNLAEGQLSRKIPAECTDLTFNVVSPHNSEGLTLYASDGPCRDAELSKRIVEIEFLPCDFCQIGLQVSKTNSNCICKCHNKIQQYIEQCNIYSGAFVRQPQVRAWISYINDTDLNGYLIYPNCPFDYCNSFNLSIDLNEPDGADTQCAFNRSSLLCGSCQPGLSLSLGSSRCLPCPNYWPAIFIIISITAILAGIALVVLLLVLNMSVADGTLNVLIFYYNVVYANKNILFPFEEINFITVYLSWMNLELGIDVCYFPGMDTFGKIWLQLIFPAYIIFLVILIIIISSYSAKFSKLIGKKNPVATLAALILLSYAKLLEVCFKSLSFGNLSYPDGSVKMVWLPDATVKYLSGKHVLLFLAAILILLAGVVYTALLFSWQWLPYLPRWRIFRWSRNQKLHLFVETYHTLYTPKHRYWTGLLLLARAVLYLVAAVNVSNDPTVALTAIFFTICSILALKAFVGSRVYKKWPVDVLETFFYLNILLLATFTWYCLGECRNKKAAAFLSAGITFMIILLISLYHGCTYSTLSSKFKKIKAIKMLKGIFIPVNDPNENQNPPPDDDHAFHDLLDVIDQPINTNDCNIPLNKRAEPTHSVVEIHNPHQTPPNPDESNIQNIPVATDTTL